MPQWIFEAFQRDGGGLRAERKQRYVRAWRRRQFQRAVPEHIYHFPGRGAADRADPACFGDPTRDCQIAQRMIQPSARGAQQQELPESPGQQRLYREPDIRVVFFAGQPDEFEPAFRERAGVRIEVADQHFKRKLL